VLPSFFVLLGGYSGPVMKVKLYDFKAVACEVPYLPQTEDNPTGVPSVSVPSGPRQRLRHGPHCSALTEQEPRKIAEGNRSTAGHYTIYRVWF
jgi:hypothetical protein